MCGRDYSTYAEKELIVRYLNKRPVEFPKLRPSYNTAPTQDCLVLRVIEGERRFDYLRWGLVPFALQSQLSCYWVKSNNTKMEKRRQRKKEGTKTVPSTGA